jgi:hypothetical protein
MKRSAAGETGRRGHFGKRNICQEEVLGDGDDGR